MPSLCRLPDSFADNLPAFEQATRRFLDGDLAPADYRGFRVPLGIYEQRESGTFMVRIRLPAGSAFPDQLRAIARLSRQFGDGVLHVTTRQDLQIHGVAASNLPTVARELHGVGLACRGGGGNTVRNVTVCPRAGICPCETFDTTPVVLGLTELLLAEPSSFDLPRKFKIAVSGCGNDCAAGMIADAGCIARRRGDVDGFAVYVGGGLGTGSRVAELLAEFVPADQIHLVAEAVKRVFAVHGDRRNRHKARLRFLVHRIGRAGFRELYDAELAKLRQSDFPKLPARALPAALATGPVAPASPREGFARWRDRNVIPQKQPGCFLVRIALARGQIASHTLADLAQLVATRGNGTLRATLQQGLAIPWISESDLAGLHAALSDLGLADAPAPILRNLVGCTGAATCGLGLCRSPDLTDAVREALKRSGLDLEAFGEMSIYISGCPNCCGRHPIADVGLCGMVRKVDDRPAPHYLLQLGGRLGEGRTRLAQGSHATPARYVPELIVALLTSFRESAEWPDFARFLEVRGPQLAEVLTARRRQAPAAATALECFVDWGAGEPLDIAQRGNR